MASRATLEYELLGYISEFIKILDDSNRLFLLSRFSKNKKRQKFYLQLYLENKPKSDLILQEIPKILKDVKGLEVK